MPYFGEKFIESKGKPIKYNDLELIRTDRIPVSKKFSGTIKLISTNSEWKQAVCLQILKGKMRVDDLGEGKSYALWEDYLKEGICHFQGTTKDRQLLVYNAWEEFNHLGNALTNYWVNGAAMIVEINGNTRRYRCNDGHPDDNFNYIIFEVTINE